MSDLQARFNTFVRGVKGRDTRDLLQDALQLAERVQTAIVAPGPATIAGACMAAAKLLTPDGVHYYDAFPADEWEIIVHTDLAGYVQGILKAHITRTERLGGCAACKSYHVGNLLAWATDESSAGSITEVVAPVALAPAARAMLKKILWEATKGDSLVLEFDKKTESVRISVDVTPPAPSSKLADDLTPYLRLCLERAVPRNFLFHGSPGTGKTTVVRRLCHALKLRSLRVRSESLVFLKTETINSLVDTFDPDVVIFDDLDRAMNQTALLEGLEVLGRRVKFVFATVNYPQALTPALKRPGRFDEIVEIESLDETAVLTLLGEFEDALDDVRAWPVAYVREYVIRRRLLGKEKATAALVELQARAARLSSNDDDEGDE